MGKVGFRVAPTSLHSSGCISSYGQQEVYLLASSCTSQCQCFYTVENPLPLGALGMNSFCHPWMHQVRYVFPPATLVPLVLSNVWVECITGQFGLVILVVPYWRLLGFPSSQYVCRCSLSMSHHKVPWHGCHS